MRPMQIFAQKPKTRNQEMFILNISRIFSIKIVDDFSDKYNDQMVILTDSECLGYKSKNNISKAKVIDIENMPKLSTIGLYKKGVFNPVLKCSYGYISAYPIGGRPYILDHLYSLANKNLRVVGPYAINIPNYIGSCSFVDAMDFAVSSDVILDFDCDMVYELVLNDCNVSQVGEKSKLSSKDYILETANYPKYFLDQISDYDKSIQDKVESFLNEEIRNLR